MPTNFCAVCNREYQLHYNSRTSYTCGPHCKGIRDRWRIYNKRASVTGKEPISIKDYLTCRKVRLPQKRKRPEVHKTASMYYTAYRPDYQPGHRSPCLGCRDPKKKPNRDCVSWCDRPRKYADSLQNLPTTGDMTAYAMPEWMI